MDLVAVVAKEVVFRFHARVNAVAEGAGGSAPDVAADGSGVDEANPACSRSGSAAVTTELAALLTRLWLLGSKKMDAVGNVGDTAEHIEALVEEMVGFLHQCSTENLATLSLQSMTFNLNSSLRSKRRTEEVKREAIGARLMDAILSKHNSVMPDEVLGEITLYILHRHGQLDSSTDANLPAHRETAAVLCSVLPRPQVIAFTRQDSVERQRQLEELRRIVWGIRVFNKEEGKTSGIGIHHVHEMLETPVASIDTRLHTELQRLDDRLTRLRAVLQSPTCPLKQEETQRLQEEYHHALQVEHNFLTVRCMHRTLVHRLDSGILPKFDNALAELRALFAKSRPVSPEAGQKRGDVVPKRVVYPVFVTLAEAYEAAQRTLEEFVEVQSLMTLTLNSESSYPSSLPPKLAEDCLAHAAQDAPVADYEALAVDVMAMLEAVSASPEEDQRVGVDSGTAFRYYYATSLPSNADAVALECYPRSLCGFRGFCPVTYAQTGLLVPGRVLPAEDPSCAGFIVMEGGSGRLALARPRYLAFANEAALRAFAAAPTPFLQACGRECNRREPGVTLLLALADHLPRELYIEGARTVEVSEPRASEKGPGDGVKQDAGTQTGQIDSYFDRNYRWNEWDLRRQALKLANLLHMRTHSTQTVASHYRSDRTTQAAPPKTEGTQTMLDAATQPPRVVQYLKGLRGTHTSEVEQVQRMILY